MSSAPAKAPMSSELKVVIFAVLAAPLSLFVCWAAGAISAAAHPVAQPVPWSALPPLPPPPPAPPPADYSKLVTAAAIAEMLNGGAQPAKSKTTPSGIVEQTFKQPIAAEVNRDKDAPLRARAMFAALPPEGLGPSETVCEEGGGGRTIFRIIAGPLAGRFLAKREAGPPHVMTEDFLRHYEHTSCALEKSCRSGRFLPRPYIDDASMLVACQSVVKKSLKAPSRAEFPGMFEERSKARVVRDCKLSWMSWVDAPNAFNAMLRTKYECTWDPKTDLIETTLLE